MEDGKKPFGVWLIFIVALVTVPSWIYEEVQKISAAPGVDQKLQWLTFENFESFVFHTLLFLAALLMFFRKAISRWMFLTLFALGIPSIGYRAISSSEFDGDQAFLFYIGVFLVIAIYGVIAYYSFRLQRKGYYSET